MREESSNLSLPHKEFSLWRTRPLFKHKYKASFNNWTYAVRVFNSSCQIPHSRGGSSLEPSSWVERRREKDSRGKCTKNYRLNFHPSPVLPPCQVQWLGWRSHFSPISSHLPLGSLNFFPCISELKLQMLYSWGLRWRREGSGMKVT